MKNYMDKEGFIELKSRGCRELCRLLKKEGIKYTTEIVGCSNCNCLVIERYGDPIKSFGKIATLIQHKRIIAEDVERFCVKERQEWMTDMKLKDENQSSSIPWNFEKIRHAFKQGLKRREIAKILKENWRDELELIEFSAFDGSIYHDIIIKVTKV